MVSFLVFIGLSVFQETRTLIIAAYVEYFEMKASVQISRAFSSKHSWNTSEQWIWCKARVIWATIVWSTFEHGLSCDMMLQPQRAPGPRNTKHETNATTIMS